MDTLKAIIYDIKNTAYGSIPSDDSRLTDRQIKEWINEYRGLLIRRDLDKKRSLSDNISQDLGCIELIVVDKSECCNVDSNCSILRTRLPIPEPLELTTMDALFYIGNIDKTRGMELSSPVGSHWDKYNTYTSDIPKAYLYNRYIYITNESTLKYINVMGIFRDPTEASNFNKCTGDPCYTDASSYPVSNYMIPTIKQMIFQQELKLTLNTAPDTTNDSEGATQPQGS